MSHPLAQKACRWRKQMVEPVFSELKGIQGLNRFKRIGLQQVRLEFSLHPVLTTCGAKRQLLAEGLAGGCVSLLRHPLTIRALSVC